MKNDFLSDEDARAVLVRSEAGRPVSDLFAIVGKEHRDNEGGVFTASGRYVEFDGSGNEVYVPGEMAYFNRSGAPVVLEIINGIFDEPGYGNGMTTTLDMPPLTEKRLNDTLEKVKADALERCSYRCIDCLIPSAKELIDESEDYNMVTRFAEALVKKERRTLPVLYKAMFEAVNPPDLESATELAAAVDDYTLDPETSGAEDYAREYLSRLKGGDKRIDLSELVNT